VYKSGWPKNAGFVFLYVCLVLLLFATACQGPELKGNIKISGSTTVQPVSNKLAEAFKEVHPDVSFNISGGGSGAGISDVSAGKVDIGASSRELKADDPALSKFLIGWDGIAIIVHSENPVRAISRDQIVKIFSGEITGWQQLGGKAVTIKVVSREANSGTLTAFHDLVMGEKSIVSSAVIEPGNSDVRSYVSINTDAIGFVSVSFVDSTVHSLSVDTIDCSLKNCKSGRYPFVRPLYYLTRDSPSTLVKAFLDYAAGKNGQKIVQNEGYLSIK
jgi:phosphate transport system substrate-binding protein